MEALPVIDVSALLDRSARVEGHATRNDEDNDNDSGTGTGTGTGRASGSADPSGSGSGLGDGDESAAMAVAAQIDEACRHNGFFVITGHGVDPSLQARLDEAARTFFALPHSAKERVAMPRGGPAWRGWFPLGGELTSGQPDHKEGYYFGAELPLDDPRVQAGLPLHGPNLFPTEPVELRGVVLEWIDAMSTLAQSLMGGVALGLGLDRGWFERNLTTDPTVLFRIFRYPPSTASSATHREPGEIGDDGGSGTSSDETGTEGADPVSPSPRPHAAGTTAERWGVAEHTDYGLLTILAQDGSGGLQVRSGESWIEVPPLADAFVCNIGDMLDRMTGGRYRSTPHRVRATEADRLSFPFFFDPSWDAEVAPLPLDGEPATDDALTRWDATSVHQHQGTYGDYLTAKVAKVFPALFDETI